LGREDRSLCPRRARLGFTITVEDVVHSRLADTCMIDRNSLSNFIDAFSSDLAAPRFDRALSRAWRRLLRLLPSD
jgi:hypothetical protein